MKALLKRLAQMVGEFFEWYTGGRRTHICDIGRPEEYAVGTDNRWREQYGFWVVRTYRDLCVVMPGATEPWAWPLVRVHVWRDEEGRLLVDTGRRFHYERGEWQHPDSFVRLKEKDAVKGSRSSSIRSVG